MTVVKVKKINCIDPQEKRRDELYFVGAQADGPKESSQLIRVEKGGTWEGDVTLFDGTITASTGLAISLLERDLFRDGSKVEGFLTSVLGLVRDLAVDLTPDVVDGIVRHTFDAVSKLTSDEVIGTVVIRPSDSGALVKQFKNPPSSRFSWHYEVTLEVTG